MHLPTIRQLFLAALLLTPFAALGHPGHSALDVSAGAPHPGHEVEWIAAIAGVAAAAMAAGAWHLQKRRR